MREPNEVARAFWTYLYTDTLVEEGKLLDRIQELQATMPTTAAQTSAIVTDVLRSLEEKVQQLTFLNIKSAENLRATAEVFSSETLVRAKLEIYKTVRDELHSLFQKHFSDVVSEHTNTLSKPLKALNEMVAKTESELQRVSKNVSQTWQKRFGLTALAVLAGSFVALLTFRLLEPGIPSGLPPDISKLISGGLAIQTVWEKLDPKAQSLINSAYTNIRGEGK